MCVLLVPSHSYIEKYNRKRYHEVVFPNRFTCEQPWGVELPVLWNNPNTEIVEIMRNMAIPMGQLVHVTHDVEAVEICKGGGEFTFITRQKFGKALGVYDGSPCGESFKPNQKEEATFVKIYSHETIFPGLYSWWGIAANEQECIAQISSAIRYFEECGKKLDVPEYLKEKPESRYGNKAFECCFQHLLFTYIHSRNVTVDKICFRKGGTLRYTHEICYVLIISTDDDQEVLADFEPLESVSPLFNFNGFINDDTIQDINSIPTFHPQYTVSSFDEKSYSYETVAVAFYFPIPAMKVCGGSERRVGHDFCVKKKPNPETRRFSCPNYIFPV